MTEWDSGRMPYRGRDIEQGASAIHSAEERYALSGGSW
jgi:hypothetical protein